MGVVSESISSASTKNFDVYEEHNSCYVSHDRISYNQYRSLYDKHFVVIIVESISNKERSQRKDTMG